MYSDLLEYNVFIYGDYRYLGEYVLCILVQTFKNLQIFVLITERCTISFRYLNINYTYFKRILIK